MDNEQILRDEIADLRAQISELRAQIDLAGIRLGPRPETQEDINRRITQLTDAVTAAVAVDRSALCTTNGQPVAAVRASQTNETGQHDGYIVLCPDERAKGFVRPYRDRYKHVGRSICGRIVGTEHGFRTICDDGEGHAGECGIVTRRLPSEQHHEIERTHRLGGCGSVTTMGRALSETYARDPTFYGSTFCVRCNKHLPVAEFVWTADGQQVGS